MTSSLKVEFMEETRSRPALPDEVRMPVVSLPYPSYAVVGVTGLIGLTALALFAQIAAAHDPIPVLTVCEALRSLSKHNGKE